MGKGSPKYKESMVRKQKKRSLSSKNKYLKPGALAELRQIRATSRFCTDIGKKRVLVIDSKKVEDEVLETMALEKAPILSPGSSNFSPKLTINSARQKVLPGTPKTPQMSDCTSDSRLESLPMDILVKIMCHLHHDQLKAVFHVSQKIRKSVLFARQYHFNFTTPDRSRQEMLNSKTPLPTEHWPFKSWSDGKGYPCPSPHTPKAPRQGPRPPSRFIGTEVCQIAAVLFQDSAFPVRYMMPPGLPKATLKTLASNRVLFYEDELCQAVAQNKLR